MDDYLLNDQVEIKVEQVEEEEDMDLDDFLLNDQNEEFIAPSIKGANERGYMPS